MILSNIPLNNIADKLKLETSQIKEEIFYNKKLLNKISFLKKLKEKNYKNLSLTKRIGLKKSQSINDFFISYTITISFLRANTNIHVSDIKGNIKLSYTAKAVNLIGKQKRKRTIAITKLISLLIKKSQFLKNKPIAVHLNNVTFHKFLIINKLKKNFLIRTIKSFNQAPYNGCRKRKQRRKKYANKLRK